MSTHSQAAARGGQSHHDPGHFPAAPRRDGRGNETPVITVVVPEPHRSLFFPPDTWADLLTLGDVTVADDITARDVERYAQALRPARVVVTSWDCPALTAAVLDAAPGLELMAHTGASVKSYVTAESWQRGVRITQAGAAMAHAVAEVAMTMTLVLLRRVHRFDHALRTGQPWLAARQGAYEQHEIRGSRVGVIGASRTGRAYIALARALGAHVSVYDPYLRDADALGVTQLPLDELMRGSRVVCVHAPDTPKTHHLLGQQELALMPDGAVLVNSARSRLIDMSALYKEVASGRIDAALDVYDNEPVPETDPWRALENVLLTPHIGGKTVQSRKRGGEIVVAEIRRLFAGLPLQHEITANMLEIMG